MAVNLPDWIEDIRVPVAGDSFNWAGKESVNNKRSLVIHHSAGPTNQDGYVIANYHTAPAPQGHGWGGVGYHFVIRHDDHPKGAGIEYVGDLETWRAHVLNDNPGRVGICLIGNFVEHLPGKRQLELARQLVDYFISPNFVLPYIEDYGQVVAHGLIPGQSTACPGYANPNFNSWFGYLRGGSFPYNLYGAAEQLPVPAPAPEPTPVPVEQPEYEKTFVEKVYDAVTTRDAFAVDVTAAGSPVSVPEGTLVNVGGTFDFQGKQYIRTVYSVTKGTWYGLPADAFEPIVHDIPVVVETPEPSPEPETPEVTPPAEKPLEPVAGGLIVKLLNLLAILFSPILKLLGRRNKDVGSDKSGS